MKGTLEGRPAGAFQPPDLSRATFEVFSTGAEGGKQQTVDLVAQPCHFGGVRYWFTCPVCGRRAYALYWDDGFSCRTCAGLRYVSQTWSADFPLSQHFRAMAEALRHRPGPKPARFWRYAAYADYHFTRDLARLIGRIEREDARLEQQRPRRGAPDV